MYCSCADKCRVGWRRESGVAASVSTASTGCEYGPVGMAVAAVRAIIEDPARRKTVVEAARKFAQCRFSFERTTADTMAVYERVLSDAE